jgi:hypothetical protein
VQQSFDPDRDANESTMFDYYVAEIFKELDTRSDVPVQKMATLEWRYLSLLEYSERRPKVLVEELSKEPALFLEVLKSVYRPSPESGIEESEPEDVKRVEDVAAQAYRLLELWTVMPGTQADGKVDVQALEQWIKIARGLARNAGREDIADVRIGTMLAKASPMGADGVWPAEAVREVLDLFRSKRMIEGFWTGTINRRGVTRRAPDAGGTLERQEAEKYRGWAEAIQFEYPHTANALRSLAESYENDARREDDSVEQRDWRF